MTLITEPSISFDPFHLSNSLPLQSFIAHLTLTNKLSTKILNLWSVTLNAAILIMKSQLELSGRSSSRP